MIWCVRGLFCLALWGVLGSFIFSLLAGVVLSEITPWLALEVASSHYQEREVQLLLGKAYGIAALAIGILLLVAPKNKASTSLYGEARWATTKDLKKADPILLSKEGIFLGQYKGRYLRQGGQSFVLVSAGTRTGKGVSIVIPNCLAWKGSMVVSDIKLENFALTSGYRAACGQKVFLFAPGQLKTHSWNPLDTVRRDCIETIPDIQAIAALLIHSEKNQSWVTEGRELFQAIALMLLDNPEAPFTLAEIYRQISPEKGFDKHHNAILKGSGDLACYHPEARRLLGEYANMAKESPKQFDGVKAFIKQELQIFGNPILEAATSHSDFDISTLRKETQTIYLGVNAKDGDLYAPLMRLFYQQLVNVNIANMPTEDEPHQVLLMMDEFPALGKMSALVGAISYIAGYNLRFVAIVQSLAQLRDIYREQADVLMDNIHTRVFFAAKNHKNALDIANELGDMTVDSRSQSRQRGSFKAGSETTSQAKRGLLLPQEAKTIGQDAMIVLSDNCPPVIAKKVPYHRVGAFLKRCIDPSKKLPWRKPKTQSKFQEYVRPPAQVPDLDIPSPKLMNDPQGILPEEGVTVENAQEIANRFIVISLGESDE